MRHLTIPHEMTSLTCLIADDHPAVLRAVCDLVSGWGITIVASTSDGAEAARKIQELKPRLALIDLHLPQMSGAEIARATQRTAPGTAIVIFTGYDDRALLREALDAGVRGFVLKEAPLDDLRRALELVARGNLYIDPVASRHLVTDASDPALTPRERAVLRLSGDGKTNQEIGAALFLSPETVRTHSANAARKLHARTRTEAVAKAFRAGHIA